MKEILKIENLTTCFDIFERSVVALYSLNLKLHKGEMLGIVGGTGSGKSVLLKSILNLVPYPGRIESGKVFYEGKNLLTMEEEELRELRGKEISLIMPNPRSSLNPLESVGDQLVNVLITHNKLKKAVAMEKAMELLKIVEIPDPVRRINSYPHELSGGMCQRIIIAMALINSPRLLLADEISSGLDVTVQRQILDLLSNLVGEYNFSTIIVTRDFGVVANYCNRVVVMSDGVIVEIDDVKSFFDRALHPVSLQLLQSTFAAKGQRTEIILDNQTINSQSDQGELKEIVPGHYVRTCGGRIDL